MNWTRTEKLIVAVLGIWIIAGGTWVLTGSLSVTGIVGGVMAILAGVWLWRKPGRDWSGRFTKR